MLLATPVSSADTEEPSPKESGLVETDRVEVVEAWPFLVRPKKKSDVEHCRLLGPADLRVLERGRKVRVIDVTQAPPLADHVLMVDTSSSMMGRYMVESRRKGRQARAAAKAYVGWMLADSRAVEDESTPERLMLVTFDDDLIIRLPPTRITDTRTAAGVQTLVNGIGGGFKTTLNDSLFWLLDYLGGHPDRANVILISDGEDTGSRIAYNQVASIAEATNNVTLFAIGIGLPGGTYEEFLERISADTGGKYYWVRSRRAQNLAGPLEAKFEEIRRRLKGQLYVSYVTESSVEGDPEQRRPVAIQSLDDRCRVPDDGYRRSRSVRQPGDRTSATDEEPLGIQTTIPDESDSRQVTLGLEDRVFDPEPLIRYRGDPATPLWQEREVVLAVPEFDAARERSPGVPGSPEDVIQGWLEHDVLPQRETVGKMPMRREKDYSVDRAISGAAFLELREQLAAVIARQFPRYRDWAHDKVRRRFRADYERRTPPPADPEERVRYEKQMATILDSRMERIEPRDFRNDLADWLGDVSTRALALGLERRVANQMLSRPDGNLPSAPTTVEEHWLRFHDWLLFPDTVRVVTPLQLIFDADRDAFGFFRILRPRLGSLPEDLTQVRGKTLVPADFDQYLTYEKTKVPKHPFGLLLIRWLLSAPAADETASLNLARTLREQWRVTSFEHLPEEVPARERQAGPRTPSTRSHCKRRIRIGLVPRKVDTEVGPEATMLEVLLEGHYDNDLKLEETSEFPDSCEMRAGSPRIVPRCFTTDDRQLSGRLTDIGLPGCARP